jgi:hypothetical protein
MNTTEGSERPSRLNWITGLLVLGIFYTGALLAVKQFLLS